MLLLPLVLQSLLPKWVARTYCLKYIIQKPIEPFVPSCLYSGKTISKLIQPHDNKMSTPSRIDDDTLPRYSDQVKPSSSYALRNHSYVKTLTNYLETETFPPLHLQRTHLPTARTTPAFSHGSSRYGITRESSAKSGPVRTRAGLKSIGRMTLAPTPCCWSSSSSLLLQ